MLLPLTLDRLQVVILHEILLEVHDLGALENIHFDLLGVSLWALCAILYGLEFARGLAAKSVRDLLFVTRT